MVSFASLFLFTCSTLLRPLVLALHILNSGPPRFPFHVRGHVWLPCLLACFPPWVLNSGLCCELDYTACRCRPWSRKGRSWWRWARCCNHIIIGAAVLGWCPGSDTGCVAAILDFCLFDCVLGGQSYPCWFSRRRSVCDKDCLHGLLSGFPNHQPGTCWLNHFTLDDYVACVEWSIGMHDFIKVWRSPFKLKWCSVSSNS